MILYLDTSALIKAYVTESHSSDVIKTMRQCDVIATHVISYVETCATLARLQREKVLSLSVLQQIKQDFLKDWGNYFHIGITKKMLEKAADFAEAFSLRAYDSIHLAAANHLLQNTDEKIIFGCFDKKLNQAANILNFELIKV